MRVIYGDVWEIVAVVPAQAEVRGEDEFPWMVHWPPHQSDHQHLQPAALQQVHLVQETELDKPWRGDMVTE